MDLKFSAPEVEEFQRECFYYKKADWDGLYRALLEIKWELMPDDIDDAQDFFTSSVLNAVRQFVPNRVIKFSKSSHPWINNECKKAIEAKYRAFGSRNFAALRDECSRTLQRTFQQYTKTTREKLCSMKASSKQWWRTANLLLRKASNVSSIPPLRSPEGLWKRDSAGKATLLSDTFDRKAQLPPERDNEYTPTDIDISELPDDDILFSDNIIDTVLKNLD